MKKPLRVLVTGAAGQIAYALIPLLGSGAVFGADQPLVLHLLDVPPAFGALEGLLMELQDLSGMPLLQRVELFADGGDDDAFEGVDVAILLGGAPRRPGQKRRDLLAANAPIFARQGAALDRRAARGVRVLVVANPANTNCLVAKTHAPSLAPTQFSCLTRLDHDRLRGMVVRKLNERIAGGHLPDVAGGAAGGPIVSRDVKNLVVWGNHSQTIHADMSNALVTATMSTGATAWLSVEAAISDPAEREAMVRALQTRGAAVLEKRGKSSAMSAAAAVSAALNDWFLGTKTGHTSMGVWSTGNCYGVPDGLFFSFPVVSAGGGTATIVPGLHVSDEMQAHLQRSAEELLSEREEALEVVGPRARL